MLADNLIFLRNIKGLTQEQVAEVIGISRQSYSKWEQGETYPDIDKCDKQNEGIKDPEVKEIPYDMGG